jgi:hypothetical protein
MCVFTCGSSFTVLGLSPRAVKEVGLLHCGHSIPFMSYSVPVLCTEFEHAKRDAFNEASRSAFAASAPSLARGKRTWLDVTAK